MGSNEKDILIELEEIACKQLSPHPFSKGVSKENVEMVLENYLVMSRFFPHIQGVAHHDLIQECLDLGKDISSDIDATAVVGTFLCWDEFGAFQKTLSLGKKGLPEILDTKGFHFNLLVEDIEKLLGKRMSHDCSNVTWQYLQKLKDGLSSSSAVERAAYMVAFEMNAMRMIEALYASLKAVFSNKVAPLLYFEIHVGGDDPAEIYHIEMTKRLISRVVSPANKESFINFFQDACSVNKAWCEAIKQVESRESSVCLS